MPLVQIITRSAPTFAVEAVEQVFAAAGLETLLTVLGEGSDRNADLLISALVSDLHDRRVWIVDPMFVDLLMMDQDRATAARNLAGLPARVGTRNWLLITLEPASETPAGCIVVSLDDLRSGKVSPDMLRAYFP